MKQHNAIITLSYIDDRLKRVNQLSIISRDPSCTKSLLLQSVKALGLYNLLVVWPLKWRKERKEGKLRGVWRVSIIACSSPFLQNIGHNLPSMNGLSIKKLNPTKWILKTVLTTISWISDARLSSTSITFATRMRVAAKKKKGKKNKEVTDGKCERVLFSISILYQLCALIGTRLYSNCAGLISSQV